MKTVRILAAHIWRSITSIRHVHASSTQRPTASLHDVRVALTQIDIQLKDRNEPGRGFTEQSIERTHLGREIGGVLFYSLDKLAGRIRQEPLRGTCIDVHELIARSP